MTTSARKLLTTVSTAAALLISSAVMAKATGGRIGGNNMPAGIRGPKNATTTTSLKQQNIYSGVQKQQQLLRKHEQDQPGSEMNHVK